MVYFEIRRVGFNCGYNKSQCPIYTNSCVECIKNKIKEFGFEVDANTKIFEMDSNEKRVQMYRELVWQKFLNVLNLRHIILMEKDSGLPILNYRILGEKLDAGLLSGFIQANIIFSESSNISTQGSDYMMYHKFYEFQYKDFNILLKEGEFVRICLILDHNASDSLKTLVLDFLREYERKYPDKLLNLQNIGKFNFNDTIDFIVDAFNIQLVFPMVLTHTIPPDVFESLNKNPIRKALIKVAKEFLVSKPFFFIYNLLDNVKKIVNMEEIFILYEIYMLLKKNVIIPTPLKTAESRVKSFQETYARKIADIEIISSIITNENWLNELREKVKNIDQKLAKKLMNQFISKGKTAEKYLIYQEAQKEYNKALYLAGEFGFKEDVSKISYMISELDKRNKQIAFKYILNAGERAEKKKNYVDSIHYYQKGIEILEHYLNIIGSDIKIKKLRKKISKLQSYI